MNPFFIVGNKRSGTSHLVRLLNLHPQVYISHESDAVWILYQFHNGMPFSSYPFDSPLGMNATLEKCAHVLDGSKTVRENFFALQTCLMKVGNPWCPPQEKEGVLWIGDKKPFQHTDPKLADFILENLPEARFIHLIRHPFSVVWSAERFNALRGGDFWLDLTPEQALERWTMHEEWVLRLKGLAPVLDVKFEDLCADTETEMKRIFDFLSVDTTDDLLCEAKKRTLRKQDRSPMLKCSRRTLSVMELYGYEPPKMTISNMLSGLFNRRKACMK